MKDNNKGTTILLTVIGVATLLVAVVGATFAYFTATVDDNNEGQTNVDITAANLGTITFDHGKTLTLGVNNIAYPGDSNKIDFTVTADAESTVIVDYQVALNFENTFPANADDASITNIQYKVWASSSSTTGDVSSVASSEDAAQWISIKPSETSVVLGTVKLGTQGTIDTWNIAIRLNETGKEQNDDQGKTFVGTLAVTPTTSYTTEGTAYTTTTVAP